MKMNYIFYLSIVAIIVISAMLSGCLAACIPTQAYTNNTGADVSVSGDTITITGTKTDLEHDQYSDKFELKKGAYIVTWEDSNQSERPFNALLEAKAGVESLGNNRPNGSDVLVIGGFLTQPGFYKLDVIYGSTYTVTITKPNTGATLPVTIDYPESGRAATAVQLNKGTLTIDARYNTQSKASTSVDLYNVVTGEHVLSSRIDLPDGQTGTNSTTILTEGVYILDVYAPINGTSVTLSQ